MEDPDPDEAWRDMIGSSRMEATARARMSGSGLGVVGGVANRSSTTRFVGRSGERCSSFPVFRIEGAINGLGLN